LRGSFLGGPPAKASGTRLNPSVDLVFVPADRPGTDLNTRREIAGLFEPPNLRTAQPYALGHSGRPE
jgi:hypothetical protein